MYILANGNPFVHAYLESDWFGKLIFLGLFTLSTLCWILLIYKTWMLVQVRKNSEEFISSFSEKDPLNLQFQKPIKNKPLEIPHPFFEMYKTFKQHTLAIINRNHLFYPEFETFISEADLNLLDSQLHITLTTQYKSLEKNLFILSTIISLAPFLGLLGTVWGILLTFSQLNAKGFSSGNTTMLSGLSLALATTVVGLVVAIPALIGYNYLKNANKEYRKEMENFSYNLLTAIELKYRKPNHASKDSSLV